ncbi:MAG: FtsX-like permease family protein [Armatimonadota bacterium]
MTFRTLVLRGLRFHWRSHLGVLLGAILSTAILVGALAVGDSVRHSLTELALSRIGGVSQVLAGGDRFFRAVLADELSAELGATPAPVVLLRGTASGEGERRAAQVQVAGVDERFWALAPGGRAPAGAEPDSVVLNERLAWKLGAKVGSEVLLRVEKPSLLSRDAPLSKTDDAAIAIRLPVSAIASDAEFGRFSLEANQIPPYSAFVPLERLQREIELEGRANVLLVGGAEVSTAASEKARQALARHWELADGSLEVRSVSGTQRAELRTDRVFLDDSVGQIAREAVPDARGVLTYFVNELRAGGRATPYSMVAAMEAPPGPADLRDDEIVLNEWLADDLQARAGDEVTLRYFVVGPMRQLEERAKTFRVREVVPIAGAAADRTLMPDFPGVSDAENCRDWEPGIPVNLDRIRDKDETYWDRYRGTPKAFVTLAAGQEMWKNRFGSLTALRFDPAGGGLDAARDRLRQELGPSTLGLFFTPVRQYALNAASQALDFGQLFLGFSFFLIAAALILAALLFGLGVEQRSEEVGVLLALGFTPARVRRLLLAEGAGIALLAAVLGAPLGVLYTQAVILGLSTVWRGAVAESPLRFHVEPLTLVGGAAAGFLVSLLTIWLVSRRQAQVPARALLASGAELEPEPAKKPGSRRGAPGVPTAVVCVLGAAALSGLALGATPQSAAGYFFGAGGLLLIAGIAVCRTLFARLEQRANPGGLSLSGLGIRNTVRRRGRSLAAVGLLACGSFLVIAVGANRHDPFAHAEERSSGTGGFAFYGETALPVYHDLGSAAGRDEFGLDGEELAGAQLVQLRMREGDEATCLNLNRAQTPRILGVQPAALAERKAFTFSQVDGNPRDPWRVLERTLPDGEIPAVGDVNTVVWSLGKGLGGTVVMLDDRGQPRTLRIVGVLSNSILQGGLLISEAHFTEAFPSSGGYRVFLVDAPREQAPAVAEELAYGLTDAGLDLTPAPERLALFGTVENTYLSIFAALGGLGLLLGSLGLGVIVLRNVLERRSELAVLRAVGFRGRALRWLIFSEHSLLLGLGLLVGIAAAVLAVLPALRSPGAEVPYVSLSLTLAAVLLTGLLWTWLATALALRGPLMSALRSE